MRVCLFRRSPCKESRLLPQGIYTHDPKRCANSRDRPGAEATTLSHSLDNEALPNGPATLAHGEAHALLDGRGRNELAIDGHIIARHGHLHLVALGAGHLLDLACDVASPEVEHGHVAGHHRVRAAALVLLRQVDVRLELGVRRRGAWRADHLATQDAAALNATAENAHGVACGALWQVRVEHPDTGHHGFLWLLATAQDLHLIALLHNALLHAARSHRAATGD
mmetsp:Transcript_119744/g.301057  ORF Transcript_119744/g.301057 Transcript_119744/m.301057 type:complete len:224 (-) Transcript_119744:965-1636(-)